jgi:hypothetical protein
MPETMAKVRGVFKHIFYDLLSTFVEIMKVYIVSTLIFIYSIVSAHRIYERRNACLMGSVSDSVEKNSVYLPAESVGC